MVTVVRRRFPLIVLSVVLVTWLAVAVACVTSNGGGSGDGRIDPYDLSLVPKWTDADRPVRLGQRLPPGSKRQPRPKPTKKAKPQPEPRDAGAQLDAAEEAEPREAASDAPAEDAAADAQPVKPALTRAERIADLCRRICTKGTDCAIRMMEEMMGEIGDPGYIEDAKERMREQAEECRSQCVEKATEKAAEEHFAAAEKCLKIDDCKEFMKCVEAIMEQFED